MVWSFNRGEWTEAYVFLRLLGDGKVFGATTDLVKDESSFISILNIIKDEQDKILRFERFLKDEFNRIEAFENECSFKIITAPELSEKAQFLYDKIKVVSSGKTIIIPEIQKYLEDIRFNSPKANLSKSAKEKYGAKTDIIITAEDSTDHAHTVLGFSIKSHIGSPPTLFNSSQTSGFKYEIENCNEKGMHEINSKDSFVDMISLIKEKYNLRYVGCRNEAFEQNIGVVDSRMEEILNIAILLQVGYIEGASSSDVSAICEAVTKLNPINRKNPEIFYSTKFKELLFDSFAGLTASSLWNGRKKLTGGYIDVDKNGDMLFYRAVSDDVFCNYLFKYTYFDRPDRGYMKEIAVAKAKAFKIDTIISETEINKLTFKNGVDGEKNSKKGDFGYVYNENNKFFIDINFQIRFR